MRLLRLWAGKGMQTRSIAAGVVMVAVSLTARAEPAPDQVARSLGEMEWHASVCHLPTAPLKAALERYIQPFRPKHSRRNTFVRKCSRAELSTSASLAAI